MSMAFIWILAILMCYEPKLQAQPSITVEQSTRIEQLMRSMTETVKDPELISIVRDYNAKGRLSTQDMDQEKWSNLAIMDPIVKELRSNAAAKFLQAHKSDVISEAFVSGADGTKVGFLSKPSNWSHKGKPKHDDPMLGKTWLGKPEKDASTGLIQVQFGLPIMDAGKPIGSLVIGVAVNKL